MLKPASVEPRTAFRAPPRLGRTVVGAKLRVTRNRLAVTRRKSPVLTSLQFGLAVPGTVAFTALLTVAFASAFSSLKDDGLATTLLAALFATGSIGSFIGSSTTALQALYLADDIPFLLTLPIPLRVLFGSKFVEAAIGALPPSILVVSGTLGYGLTRSHNALFWLVAPILLVSSIVTATSISVVVVSVVTRYIPPKRAKLFLFAVSMSVIAISIFGWRLLAPRPDVLGNVVAHREYDPLWHAIALTPAGLGAQSMTDIGRGRIYAGIILAGLHVAAAIAMLCFSSAVFQRTFIRGLDRTTAVQTSAPHESLSVWLSSTAGFLPQRFGALVLRDWLTLVRDLKRLSGVMWPLGVVLIYTVILGHNGGAPFTSARLTFWSKNGSLALLPWGLSLGLSVYSFGSEGRNVHLLRSLPASGPVIFFSKAFASALPIAVLTIGAAATSLWFRHAPFAWSLELLLVMAWMIAGYVLIDTSAAALAPNFDAQNVQRTITLTGRLFSFVFGGAFGLATLTLVGRFILVGSGVPNRWRDVIQTQVAGVQPLGWPLIVVASGISIGAVAMSTLLAIRQTNHLLRNDT
jgi:hypothetical protein